MFANIVQVASRAGAASQPPKAGAPRQQFWVNVFIMHIVCHIGVLLFLFLLEYIIPLFFMYRILVSEPETAVRTACAEDRDSGLTVWRVLPRK